MLELDRVTRRFGDITALDEVSFQVQPGRLTGFVGANGAGKTTAMRIMMGIDAPDAGEVRWEGSPTTQVSRRRFGYMPEERGLYPKMRVTEQLVYLASLHGVDRRRATERARGWLARLGLEARSDDRLEQLSLGNQQRVQLVAALVHEPALLVLDEPFSGIDPVALDTMSEAVLGYAQDRDVPVIFSSHQLDLVERLCDQVVIIDAGRLVVAGDVEELRRAGQRRAPELRVEFADVRDAGWLEHLAGVRLIAQQEHAGELRSRLRVEDASRIAELRATVLDAARLAGDVIAFEEVRPSLTDLYRAAVAPNGVSTGGSSSPQDGDDRGSPRGRFRRRVRR